MPPTETMELASARPDIGDRLTHLAQPGWDQFLSDLYADELEVASTVTEEDRNAQVAEMMKRAWKNPDDEELANALLIKVGREYMAHLDLGMAFFDVVNLDDDQYPIVETKTFDQDWTMTYIGEQGEPPQKQLMHRLEHEIIRLKVLSTPDVWMPVSDLMLGNVAGLYDPRQRLEYEMRLTTDAALLALIDATDCTAASGLRAKLTLHPSIVAANIPDKNYYNLTSLVAGQEGKICVEKMRQIWDYVVRFTSDVETDGSPLIPKALFVSSQRMVDFTEFVDLVGTVTGSSYKEDPSGTVPTGVRDSIWRTGGLTNWWGMEIPVIPVNRLAANQARLAFNKPVGTLFRKASQDRMLTNEDRPHRRRSFSFEQCLASTTYSPQHYCAMRIKW